MASDWARLTIGRDAARAVRDFWNYRLRYRKIIEHMEFDLVLSQFPARSEISVLDVGAHHGEILDVLRSSASRHCFRVLCVEPLSINCAILRCRALASHRTGKMRVQVAPVALGPTSGERTFYLGSSSSLSTGSEEHVERFSYAFQQRRKVSIRQLNWPDFAAEFNLPLASHFNIVKIDAEGMDQDILMSLLDSDISFDAVIVEFSFKQNDLAQLVSRLREAGLSEQYAFIRDATRTLHIGSLVTDSYLGSLMVEQPETTGNLVCYR